MKKYVLFLTVVLFFSFTLSAEKPLLTPYGFIKGDMYYASKSVKSWNTKALTCASIAAGADGGNGISFTAQHTRFGLKGSGSLGSIMMGGVLELDFFWIASDANARPRMRLAYAWIKPAAGLEIRAGQQWDIFSPLNPTTNNTNANLWYNGNYGFRRPQFQVRYNMELGSVNPSIQVSAGEATKDTPPDSYLGEDNISKFPLLQARVAVDIMSKAQLGIAAVYVPYGEFAEWSTAGLSADLNLPLHDLFSVKGEFALGTNLNNANLFTLGGNGEKGNPVENRGYWFNIISKPFDHLHVVAGLAQEFINLHAADIDENFTGYCDLIFPVGGYFSFSIEGQGFITAYSNGKTRKSAVIDVACKITF